MAVSGKNDIFKPQIHDRGPNSTERILQTEEQILERFEEEPHIITRRLAAEVGVLQFVVPLDFAFSRGAGAGGVLLRH